VLPHFEALVVFDLDGTLLRGRTVCEVLAEPLGRLERMRDTEMTARADIASVRAYRSAVGLRTREVVRTLPSGAWDEIVGAEDIERGGRAGAFRG
jgi:hypothetical protein